MDTLLTVILPVAGLIALIAVILRILPKDSVQPGCTPSVQWLQEQEEELKKKLEEHNTKNKKAD